MTKIVIPSTADDYVLSFEYDPTGLAWARLYDNVCLGWLADDADPSNPAPVIIGSMPTPAPATGAILSPQWAHVSAGGGVAVPNLWRGNGHDFLTWLATNNGARRQLAGRFMAGGFAGIFSSWSFSHPELATP
jgi:hypothetical protein